MTDGWTCAKKNMKAWRERLTQIVRMVENLPTDETSSRTMHNTRKTGKNLTEIDPARSAGGSSPTRRKGRRMKA